jgi:hypothetical protein
MTSARVRLEERVGFASVVVMTFVVWGDRPNCERFLNSRSRKSRLVQYVCLNISGNTIPQQSLCFRVDFFPRARGIPARFSRMERIARRLNNIATAKKVAVFLVKEFSDRHVISDQEFRRLTDTEIKNTVDPASAAYWISRFALTEAQTRKKELPE